jgi:hypothetical protein
MPKSILKWIHLISSHLRIANFINRICAVIECDRAAIVTQIYVDLTTRASTLDEELCYPNRKLISQTYFAETPLAAACPITHFLVRTSRGNAHHWIQLNTRIENVVGRDINSHSQINDCHT